MNATRVVALVPTSGRAPQLARLLDSMARSSLRVDRVYVTDNRGDAETAEVVARASVPVDFIVELAPGPAAAQCAGWRRAQKDPTWTHALLIDDDAELASEALRLLTHEMERAGAVVGVPLIEDGEGCIGWYPGVNERCVWNLLRQPKQTADAFLKQAGRGSFSFKWAPWTCLLAARKAVTDAGEPDSRYGIEGEDIDYVLRLLEQGKGVLVPQALVRHVQVFPVKDTSRMHARRCLGVQNIAYLATRTRHGRAIRRYVPGHVWRLLVAAAWHPSAVCDAFVALWRGAVLGRQGAHPKADQYFRKMFEGRSAQ